MVRVLVGFLLLAGSGFAQAQSEPLRFQFQQGQTLTYAVRQVTSVTEVTLDDKTNMPTTAMTVTKLTLTRRWEVKSVDANGVGTLEMSIAAMRQEIARPGPADKDGKPTVDSLVIDSATAEGKQQTAEYLNKPIVTAKIDSHGRLLDAKSAAGATDRLQAELPLRITFPEAAPVVGTPWNRPFSIKLDPPFGTGEQYEATQTYTLKKLADGTAIVGVSTALKSPPTDPAQLPAIVPLMWEGELTFQPRTGRYAGAKLTIKKDIANHQGTGSKFTFASDYTETLEK